MPLPWISRITYKRRIPNLIVFYVRQELDADDERQVSFLVEDPPDVIASVQSAIAELEQEEAAARSGGGGASS